MGGYKETINRKAVTFRVAFGIMLVLCAYLVPFWLTSVLALIGLLVFSNYFEAVIPFFISDLVFGAPGFGLAGYQFGYSVIAVLVVLTFVYLIRPNVSYYKS